MKVNMTCELPDETDQEPILFQTENRLAGLYGPITEENCSNLIGELYQLKESGKQIIENNTIFEPIQLIISTEGGAVLDTFAVYDVLRDIQKECEIHTYGLGKVMSSGILLLVAGTKGKRKAGKYCRFMLHSIGGGNPGQIHDYRNFLKELNWCQESYISALEEKTNLTKKKLLSIFRKKMDIYFDAQQALEWGIIDEII